MAVEAEVKPMRDIARAHKRIAVVGGPLTGKTTVSREVTDRPVLSTDDTMDADWADQPEIAKRRVEGMDAFVLEGVQAARALRKGLEVDAIVVMETPKGERTKGQAAMAKGQEKIIADALAMNPGVVVYWEGE